MPRLFSRCIAFIILLIGTIQFALPAHAQTSDRPCRHGMRVVGEQTIYLSHMGLFNHDCHDYQALFEVSFEGPNDPQTIYLEAQNQDPTQNEFTIQPIEKFVLPDLASGEIASFKARLHQGQYERVEPEDAGLLDGDVTINVKRVLHFRRFDPNASLPPTSGYLLFGTDTEQLVAHLITTPPDFDQIVSVTTPLDLTNTQLASALRLVLPDRLTPDAEANLDQALQSGEQPVVRIDGQQPDMTIEAGSQYFLETADYAS